MNDRILSLCLAVLLSGCADDGKGLPGTLERKRLELTAELAEPVAALHVAEGAQVSEGELLLELDPTRAQQRVRAASAQRDQAAARLDELQKGPRAEQIEAASAALSRTRAQLERAEQQLERTRELARQELASEDQLDEAQSARKAAAASVREARARLNELVEGTRAERIAQARAQLDAAEAHLAEARLVLSRMRITAPVAGQVEALPFRAGERPPPGAALVIMTAARPVYARVYVPQAMRASAQSGMPARVTLVGEDRPPLPAHVRYLSDQAAFTPYYSLTEKDRGRLSYLAEVHLDEPPAHLPGGVPVLVRFGAEAGDD